MKLDAQAIGNRIKQRREELNLKQLDIKAETGISSGNLSDIEQGKRLPAAATLVGLSQVLKCSIDYILTGSSPIKEKYNLSEANESSQRLLNLFYILSNEDQNELLMIAEMKANKGKIIARGGNACL